MGFWKNVENRRYYLGISRKELAARAGIKYAVIGAGLERDSIPAANTALHVAKALHIPLENLLDEDFSVPDEYGAVSARIKEEEFLAKYRDVYTDLEALPPPVRQTIMEMVHKLAGNARGGYFSF